MKSRSRATAAIAVTCALLATLAVLGPIGRLDVVMPGGGGGGSGAWMVGGWAADPDAPGASIAVRVYVDGAFAAEFDTFAPRPDVAAAFPWAGASAGFFAFVPGTARQRVCAYAMNVGAGTENTTLGCNTGPLRSR